MEKKTVKSGILLSIVNIEARADAEFKFESRLGADKDAGIMKRVFVDVFGFKHFKADGKFFTNLTITDWNHALPKNRGNMLPPEDNCHCVCCSIKRFNFELCDCLAFTISSHGIENDGETMISFVDGYLLPVSEIFEVLGDANCPGLKGKPRLFFIQVCRNDPKDKKGQEYDRGVEIEIPQLNSSVSLSKKDMVNAEAIPPEIEYEIDMKLRIQRLTTHRDRRNNFEVPRNFAVVYPTWSGRYSFRGQTEASWMEQELEKTTKRMLIEGKTDISFIHLITKVSTEVAFRQSQAGDADSSEDADHTKPGMKNAVVLQHSLTQPIYFKVKAQ